MQKVIITAILIAFLSFTTCRAQSLLQEFIDCGITNKWQVGSGFCGYSQVEPNLFFTGLCEKCYVYARDRYDLPSGTKRESNGSAIIYDYNIFFTIKASDRFDPTDDKVRASDEAMTIMLLFSTRQAYEKELRAIQGQCSFNELDGSFRENSGKYMAVPMVWANNAPKPRLYRGFRVDIK